MRRRTRQRSRALSRSRGCAGDVTGGKRVEGSGPEAGETWGSGGGNRGGEQHGRPCVELITLPPYTAAACSRAVVRSARTRSSPGTQVCLV